MSLQANDSKIGRFRWIASLHGIEDVNWRFQWLDAGRAKFCFDTEERLVLFVTTIRILGISN